MQPSGILMKFFGLKDGQTNMEFIGEMKELKNADFEGYKETIKLAAIELRQDFTRAMEKLDAIEQQPD